MGSPLSQFISETAGKIILATAKKLSKPISTAMCIMCLRALGLLSASRTRRMRAMPINAGIMAVTLFPKCSFSPGLGLGSIATFFQFDNCKVTLPSFPAWFL